MFHLSKEILLDAAPKEKTLTKKQDTAEKNREQNSKSEAKVTQESEGSDGGFLVKS